MGREEGRDHVTQALQLQSEDDAVVEVGLGSRINVCEMVL